MCYIVWYSKWLRNQQVHFKVVNWPWRHGAFPSVAIPCPRTSKTLLQAKGGKRWLYFKNQFKIGSYYNSSITNIQYLVCKLSMSNKELPTFFKRFCLKNDYYYLNRQKISRMLCRIRFWTILKVLEARKDCSNLIAFCISLIIFKCQYQKFDYYFIKFHSIFTWLDYFNILQGLISTDDCSPVSNSCERDVLYNVVQEMIEKAASAFQLMQS